MTADRFDRVDQTLDRILRVLGDHGGQLAKLNAGQAEIRADLREIRKQAVGMHEALTELSWHLGQAR